MIQDPDTTRKTLMRATIPTPRIIIEAGLSWFFSGGEYFAKIGTAEICHTIYRIRVNYATVKLDVIHANGESVGSAESLDAARSLASEHFLQSVGLCRDAF